MTDDDIPPGLEELHHQMATLGKAPVTAPPWAKVVDRITAPAPTAAAPTWRRFAMGWGWPAAVIGAIALALGVAGAVSDPVRETVFEPVANLLPWVDDSPAPATPARDPEPPPAVTDPGETDEPEPGRPAETGDPGELDDQGSDSRGRDAPQSRPQGKPVDDTVPTDRPRFRETTTTTSPRHDTVPERHRDHATSSSPPAARPSDIDSPRSTTTTEAHDRTDRPVSDRPAPTTTTATRSR